MKTATVKQQLPLSQTITEVKNLADFIKRTISKLF